MRKPISKKIRFEVFKRDNFTCCYCGKSAPKVILEIDHIKSVKNGGDNSLLNLITSCYDCNRGKSHKKLNDFSELEKQTNELNKLQQQRDKIIELQQWREKLKKNDKKELDFFKKQIRIACNDKYKLLESGDKKLKSYIKRFDKKELLEAIDKAFSQYFKLSDNEEEQSISFDKAFSVIPNIIKFKNIELENPNLKNAFYCRAILRNRFGKINEWNIKNILLELLENYTFDCIKNLCIKSRNMYDFMDYYRDWIKEVKNG